MSANPLGKIDSFNFILAGVILTLLLLVFVTLKGIVSTISIASRAEEQTAAANKPIFDKGKFEKAYKEVFQKEKVLLDLQR